MRWNFRGIPFSNPLDCETACLAIFGAMFCSHCRHLAGMGNLVERYHIMLMQPEIKQRFTTIEHDIEQAAITCQADKQLPQKLRDCVTQWKQHAAKAKPAFESQDNKKMKVALDDLEEIAQRAEIALHDVAGDNSKIRGFVEHAHSGLSDLQRKLH